ncbi:hypothetical protein [Algibacter mikhailovii]|uniref:Uncharacterized protein n=1 Tax=Algibacter mikhailovii TaxID=425498 RepID=A0A918QY45_9FLAO|nr:hypothetical protein [Algibacter mikhailovii]GGZ77744.1 hypothetical protein GCM10007028_13810 [Algibacter mikhailovii]
MEPYSTEVKKLTILVLIFMNLLSYSQTKFIGIAMSANLPSGWVVQEENYGQILLSNPKNAAGIMFIEHGWTTEQMVLEKMQQEILEEGWQASLATDIMELDNGDLIALYQGRGNGQEIVVVAVVSRSKLWGRGGVMTVVLVPKNSFNDDLQDLAVVISKSIKYRSIMNPKAEQSADIFKGRKLIRYNSYYTSDFNNTVSVGSNSKTTIHFCSNGGFAIEGYSDLSSGGPGMDGEAWSNTSAGEGLRSLMDVNNYMVLRLASNAGEVSYMPIERYTEDGAYYINDDKWVIGGSDLCN